MYLTLTLALALALALALTLALTLAPALALTLTLARETNPNCGPTVAQGQSRDSHLGHGRNGGPDANYSGSDGHLRPSQPHPGPGHVMSCHAMSCHSHTLALTLAVGVSLTLSPEP